MSYVAALRHQNAALAEPSHHRNRQRWVLDQGLSRLAEPHAEHYARVASGQSDIRPLITERVRSLSAELTDGPRYVVEELIALLEGEEHDEQGVLRPTLFAFRRTFHLIQQVGLQLREHFPRAAVSTDSEGGCRIQWLWPKRQVRLIVPAQGDGQQYIYHQEGNNYSVEEDVSPQRLVEWLNWLQGTQ
jgi:hypothetical protein